MEKIRFIILLIAILFCRIAVAQIDTGRYHLLTTQKVVFLSDDTICIAYKCGDEDGDINFLYDAYKEDTVYYSYVWSFKPGKKFAQEEIWVKEIRTIKQTDTILDYFPQKKEEEFYNDSLSKVEVSNLPRNILKSHLYDNFTAKVKASYLFGILDKANLLIKSDSIWRIMISDYVASANGNGNQYYIYQYCAITQKLYLSRISFASDLTYQITFSDSIGLVNKDIKFITKNITKFNKNKQVNCIVNDRVIYVVYSNKNENKGVFRSYECDRLRGDFPNLAFGFAFLGRKYFDIYFPLLK